VTHQVANVLGPDILLKMNTNECHSSGGVHSPTESRSHSDLLKLPPYVPPIEWSAILAAEHKVVFLSHLPGREPFGGLAGAMRAERLDRLSR
jgi:hypothetical protein